MVLQAEFIEFSTIFSYRLLNQFHHLGMLLCNSLDILDIQVHGKLYRSQKISNNVTYHSISDMIELVVEVRPLKTDNAVSHLLHFVVAVLNDMVLALLHLLDFLELLDDDRTDLILLDLIIHRYQSLFEVCIRCHRSGIYSFKFTIDMLLQIYKLLLNLVDEGLVLLCHLHRPLITLSDASLSFSTAACFRHES